MIGTGGEWDWDGHHFTCWGSDYVCLSCHLEPSGRFDTDDLGDFLAHVKRHRKAGDPVPDYTHADICEWHDSYQAAIHPATPENPA